MKWFLHQMKIVPINPMSPATVFLFSFLYAHQLVILPGHYSLSGNNNSWLK